MSLESRRIEEAGGVSDLNLKSPFPPAGVLPYSRCACRNNGFRSSHVLGPPRTVSTLRRSLSRRLQGD